MAKPEHLQAQLDRLFAFTKMSKEGEEVRDHCPSDLARYTLANANPLPLIALDAPLSYARTAAS